MRGDFSRVTFDPANHYSGVRLQQGRAHLDAEWNEQLDIEAHRDAETTLDLIGPAGAPYDGGGFLVGTTTGVRDVDVAGAAGWAVGEDGLLLRLVGGAWTLEAPPEGTGDLNALLLTVPDAGFAVGDGAVVLVLAPPAGGGEPGWTPETLPAGVTADLHGVAAVGDEAWAVGADGTILYRGEDGWVSQSPPEGTTTTLRGVHFADAKHGWAVGDDATVLATVDGTTWERQTVPRGTRGLLAVFGRDPDHAWAVGRGGTILAWDPAEQAWVAQPSDTTSDLRALHFANNLAGIVVGGDGTILVTPDGGDRWDSQDPPAGRPDLYGLAVAASPARAYAVGDDASLVREPEGDQWTAGPALPAGGGRSLTLSAGDLYVEGVRVVNEHPVGLTGQPDLTFLRPGQTTPGPVFPPPGRDQTYGVYLEVFEQLVTALEREELREVALGGPDTATRTRTVWQAKLLAPEEGQALDCAALQAALPPEPRGDGRMRARDEPGQETQDECSLAAGGGFRGLENQLYRIEVHDGSDAKDGPTFKWSHDNGMVVARLEAVEVTREQPTDPATGSVTVSQPGRDEVLAFGPRQLVELTDETRTQRGEPGVLLRVTEVRGNVLEVAEVEPGTLPDPLTLADFPLRPTARRWDGRLTLEDPGWQDLEDGVQVQFGGTGFRTGDHWSFTARSVTGTVEWPRQEGQPRFQEPHGPSRRFAPLALVHLDGDGLWSAPTDCRRRFPPLTGLVHLFYVGGDGQEAVPDLTEPRAALAKLDRPLQVGVSNWRWPVQGAQVRFEVEAGNGRLNGGTDPTVTVPTGPNGIAACTWELDASTASPILTQQATATLLDEHTQPMQTPIVFNASLSVAAEVAYVPATDCVTMKAQGTVQAAIDTLTRLTRIFPASGTGIDLGPAGPGREPPVILEVVAVNECGPVQGAEISFTPLDASGSVTNTATTNERGRAIASWQPDASTLTQRVVAKLTDPGTGNLLHVPDEVTFVANRNLASEVAYLPGKGCGTLPEPTTVQAAIDTLTRLTRIFPASGTGIDLGPAGPQVQLLTLEVVAVSDCGPVAGATVMFHATPGSGSVVDTTPVPTDTNGRALTQWRPDDRTTSQQVVATLVEPGPGNLRHLPDQVTFVANRPPVDPAVHVEDVTLLSGQQLRNDQDVTADQLAAGLRVTCDQELDQRSARGKPVCQVTLELPFPLNQADRDLWGAEAVGTQPLTLDAGVGAEGTALDWTPALATQDWLTGRLFEGLKELGRGDRVLARLTVKGNFVWGLKDPGQHLDGEVFGFVEDASETTDVRLPSGDGHHGGDLEMWFWLRPGSSRLPAITGLVLNPPQVVGGGSVAGVLLFDRPAPPGGFEVGLSSSIPIAQPIPGVVAVPDGQAKANFTVTTQQVLSQFVVAITASTPESTMITPLIVDPLPVFPV